VRRASSTGTIDVTRNDPIVHPDLRWHACRPRTARSAVNALGDSIPLQLSAIIKA
jgi:hypothetical protein